MTIQEKKISVFKKNIFSCEFQVERPAAKSQ